MFYAKKLNIAKFFFQNTSKKLNKCLYSCFRSKIITRFNLNPLRPIRWYVVSFCQWLKQIRQIVSSPATKEQLHCLMYFPSKKKALWTEKKVSWYEIWHFMRMSSMIFWAAWHPPQSWSCSSSVSHTLWQKEIKVFFFENEKNGFENWSIFRRIKLWKKPYKEKMYRWLSAYKFWIRNYLKQKWKELFFDSIKKKGRRFLFL